MVFSASSSTPAYTLSTSIDCGPVIIEFLMQDADGSQTPISQDNSDQPIVIDSAAETLRVGYTEDTSYAGSYSIVYSVTLENYDPASK